MTGIYLLDVDTWTGSAVETLRLSTETFATKPSDTPANTIYEGRISDAGALSMSLFKDGGISGSPSASYGAIEFANSDGGLDAWLNYGFDGRPFTLRYLQPGSPVASARLLARGTVLRVDTSNATSILRLQIRDRLAALDVPLLTERYAGTTITAGATAEGTVDLKDQIKPRVFGSVVNIQPVLANPFNLIYQVSSRPVSAVTVYDGGVPLVYAGDYPTLPILVAVTMVPGTYATCLAAGLFRLGGSAVFTITADALEGATAANRSAARVAARMLDQIGLTSAFRNDDTFDAAHAFNPAEVGIWVDDDGSALELIGQVLNSVGAGILPNAAEKLEVFTFSAPTGVPAATLTRRDLIAQGASLQLIGGTEAEGQGIPAWSLVLNYARVWRTMNSGEVAGSVSDDRKAYLAKSFRQATAQNPNVKIAHLLASEITIETLLVSPAAAAAEAARRLGLYQVRRERLVFPVPLERAIEIGLTVEVKMQRFGYDTGKLFIVTGREDDFGARISTLELWG